MDTDNSPQPDQPEAEKLPEQPASIPAEEPTEASAEAPAEEPGGTSTEAPGTEPGQTVSNATSPASAQPRPGLFRRFLHFLFNPETSLGRNMRNAVRAFVYGLLMFALGMLFYFILVRPELDELDIARTTLKANQQQISSLQATQAADQKQLADLQTSLQKSQADLQKTQLRAGLLELLNQIDSASIAVLNKDGPTAQRNLADARTNLSGLLPAIQAVDPNIATQLDARLTLVNSELVDNPATAQSDLALLNTTLVNFDKTLAEGQ